ncbi:MAG: hypothetical protein EKK42_32485 [Pseudonocardiaceae bacterium]|nr:MAG: hypothetical protein EKK42_32485 [Pseudonocardiaceae bacterium]
MLLRRPVLDAIAAGRVTRVYRRWDRARVKVGTRLRTAVGVLEVTAVDTVAPESLTDADAAAAGVADAATLRLELAKRPTGDVFRIDLRPAGEDPRIALRADDALDDDARAALDARLARMDATSPYGPWTAATLALIAENPEVRAPDLAERMGRETLPFKRDVRKLKELGLTESLPVGYRLSPRGRAYLRN